MNDIADSRKKSMVQYHPHPYKANYVWFILIVIFRQYIIVPKHLMLRAALNACLSIQCRFRHLMPSCIGINKNSTENYRIMPILAYNASNGFKCQNRHYNIRINGRFTTRLSVQWTSSKFFNKKLNIIEFHEQICWTSSNSPYVCIARQCLRHTSNNTYILILTISLTKPILLISELTSFIPSTPVWFFFLAMDSR